VGKKTSDSHLVELHEQYISSKAKADVLFEFEGKIDVILLICIILFCLFSLILLFSGNLLFLILSGSFGGGMLLSLYLSIVIGELSHTYDKRSWRIFHEEMAE